MKLLLHEILNVLAIVIYVAIVAFLSHLYNKSKNPDRKHKPQNSGPSEDRYAESKAGADPFATDRNDYINLYLRGVFQLAGYIGKCTDDQNPYRNAIVQDYIRRMATSPETAEICKTAFFAGCDEYYSPKQAARYFERYTTWSRKKPNIRYLMNFIITIALCDGRISEVEDERLHEICDLLSFRYRDLNAMIDECRRLQAWKNFVPDSEEFTSRDSYDWSGQQAEARRREEQRKQEEQRKREHCSGQEHSTSGDDSSGDAWNPNAPKDAFQVLGVPESASERQIKKAFHKLIRKYHPDLLKGRGLPEEMSQMYADKTRIINEAYETVRKYRNF